MRIFVVWALVIAALAGLYHSGQLSALVPGGSAGAPDPGALVRPPYEPASNFGKALNPSGTVFEHGFKAFYFSRGNPAAAVEDYAPNVAVKYAWSDLHGIDSQAFGAYWVGQLHFDTPGRRQVAVSLSWAKARIFIDGEQVRNGSDSGEFTHYFSAGAHLLEVEYVNNWHTVEFKVTVEDPIVRRPLGDIGRRLRSSRAGPEVYYVGLYESGREDTSVDVQLPRTGKPATLWLDSYEAIDWNVSAPDGLAAVVIASYSPGSRVLGDRPELLLHAERGFRVNSRSARGCSCHAGHFHCDQETGLPEVAGKLHEAGLRLAGAATQYSATEVTVALSTPTESAGARLNQAATARARRQCRADADRDFDRLRD
jgi:hypothetical protein